MMIDDERAVVIRVGATEFGIDVRQVRQVLRPLAITRLPFPPPTILGIASVRGTLVPVMDLGQRLLGTPSARDGKLIVVAEPDGDGSVGLLVDAVLDLVLLDDGVHEPPAEVEESLPAGWIRGVLAPDADRLVTLLDLTQVLDLHHPAAEESR
jgi:purine-binding chemotaxis protein CheW